MGNYSASELFFYGIIITVVAVLVLNPANWIWFGLWIVGPKRREKFLEALRQSIDAEPDPQSKFVQLWVLNSALMGSKYDDAKPTAPAVQDVYDLLAADDYKLQTFCLTMPSRDWRALFDLSHSLGVQLNELLPMLHTHYKSNRL